MSLKKASRTKSLSLSEDFPMRIPKPRNILTTSTAATSRKVEETGKILKYIDDNIIGKGVAFLGPFGRRKVVYADYSSSGRSLQFLEDYINKEVLPAYGDITCTSAVTGLQSQLYSNEARDLVRSAVNASDDDHVFFCEGASTSLSERLCYMLCCQNDFATTQTDNSDTATTKSNGSPVLFVSTNESPKNLAPWLNAGAEIVRITKTREGFLDLVDLEKKLSMYAESKRLLIGLFAGASRLTGILADDVATTILLHQYNGIAVWDYSPAAPFASIDMNPVLPGSAKDVVFFCSSKFIGGVQGPGVVVIKKKFLSSTFSEQPIGVIESVRAGLVIQLKESLGALSVAHRQEKLCKQILSHIRTIPEFVLLGPTQTTAKRIPTLCFLVKHPRGAFLHHRFVVAILNDIFGIQATVGSHLGEALGISSKLAVDYERILNNELLNYNFLKPGYTKLLIPFFMSDAEVAFVLEALKMVATEAWKLLPQYEIDEKTGEWRHHSNSLVKERKWLGAIRYIDGRMLFTDRRISGPGAFPQNYSDCLQTARNIFNRARKIAQKSSTPYLELKLRNSNAELLRWYMLPSEAHELLLGHSQNVKNSVPFDPNKSKVSELPSLLTMFRHNSLSALDVKRFKSRSLPTSPVQITIKRQQSSPMRVETSKTASLTDCSSPPVVRFSLGGEVTTIATFSTPRIATLVSEEEGISSRNRCHSWSSSAGGVKSISPQARINVGLATHYQQISSHRSKSKQRLCSCSSQTELFSPDSIENSSPTPSLQNSLQAGSTCSDCTEEIQAYVTEATKELATEIKAEIREVISKVEDVLESTDTMDMSSINMSLTNLNATDDSRSDSVSATDVAEYLKEFSKEMASEVKSEIREAVNAMTDIIPLDSHNSARKNSPPEILTARNALKAKREEKLLKQRYSDTAANCKRDIIEEKLRSESFPRPNSTPAWHHTTAPSPESSTPSCPYTGTISKLIDPVSTASQDSGINMCFHEHDETRTRTVSENLNENRIRTPSKRSQSDSVQCVNLNNDGSVLSNIHNCDCNVDVNNRPATPLTEEVAQTCKTPSPTRRRQSESEPDQELNRWHPLPKDVWRQTAEAIDEFDMLKDGDRILVCLSGSSASLCLLHALRQFSRARGIHIEMAAVTMGKCGIDPRALMLYMRDLSTELYIEPLAASESYRTKISSLARRRQYNVLAMGNTLDKLADEFLISILYKGKLHATQAHSKNSEGDLRVIRPFIYVRERLLEDFCVHKNLPTRPSRTFAKVFDSSSNILKMQEISNPSIYDNIKNALRPLLSIRLENNKTSYEFLKLSLISRE